MKQFKYYGILFALVLLTEHGTAQFSGFIRSGVNIGSINEEAWIHPFTGQIYEYKNPLIRPILGIGTQFRITSNLAIRQEFLYQTKGQGTIRPSVWSLFNTYDKDVLRFISFPISIHYRLVSQLYAGVAFQPSYYLSGTDNYYASDNWKGWIYGGTFRFHYTIREAYEVGIEYDHDFTLYYCGGCNIRFSTIRIYGLYHFF